MGLRQRPGARYPKSVAQRRVDPERHVPLEAVVDNGGNESTLLGGNGLPFHHRGDRRDLIRGASSTTRGPQVDHRPPLLESGKLIRDQRLGARVSVEVVEGGEEEPSRLSPASTRKARGGRALRAASAYAAPVRRGVTFRRSMAIRRTSATRSAIWRALQPSGKTIRRTAGLCVRRPPRSRDLDGRQAADDYPGDGADQHPPSLTAKRLAVGPPRGGRTRRCSRTALPSRLMRLERGGRRRASHVALGSWRPTPDVDLHASTCERWDR